VAIGGQSLTFTIRPAIELRSTGGVELSSTSIPAPVLGNPRQWRAETTLIVDNIPAEAVRIQGENVDFPVLDNNKVVGGDAGADGGRQRLGIDTKLSSTLGYDIRFFSD